MDLQEDAIVESVVFGSAPAANAVREDDPGATADEAAQAAVARAAASSAELDRKLFAGMVSALRIMSWVNSTWSRVVGDCGGVGGDTACYWTRPDGGTDAELLGDRGAAAEAYREFQRAHKVAQDEIRVAVELARGVAKLPVEGTGMYPIAADSSRGRGPPAGDVARTSLQDAGAKLVDLMSEMRDAIVRLVTCPEAGLVKDGPLALSLPALRRATANLQGLLKICRKRNRLNREAVELNGWEKMRYSLSWLVWFIAACLALYLYLILRDAALSGSPSRTSGNDMVRDLSSLKEVALETSARQNHARVLAETPFPGASVLYGLLWAGTPAGRGIMSAVLLWTMLHFVVYVLATERRIGDEEWSPIAGIDFEARHFTLELVTAVAFTCLAGLRLYAVTGHPQWQHFGRTAIPRFAIGNVYMLLELFGTATFWWHLRADRATRLRWSFLWLHMCRALEVIGDCGFALGLRAIRQMLQEEWRLLVTAYMIAIVFWLALSTCYFIANRHNDKLLWDAVHYRYEYFNRFESIPSTSFYCFINLMKEPPVADSFETFWPRFFVCLSCIIGFPIFAIPTAILQSNLMATHDDEDEPLSAPQAAAVSVLSKSGRWATAVSTGLLAFLSFERFVSFTCRDTRYGTWFGLEFTRSSGAQLAVVDGVVAWVFLVDFCNRMWRKGRSYLWSCMSVVDVFAWSFGLLHASLFFSLGEPAFEGKCWSMWLRAACLFRVLKLERYLHIVEEMFDIMHRRRSILIVAMLLCMLNWLLVSQLLYITEHANPDHEMQEPYAGMGQALWAELINLHGEFPWVDYTPPGKTVIMFVGFFSIMVFCIPTSVMTDGFMQRFENCVDRRELDTFDRRSWRAKLRPAEPGRHQEIYDVLYMHLCRHPREYTSGFRLVRSTSIGVILASTLSTILSTVDGSALCEPGDKPIGGYACQFHELVSVSCYMCDFVAVTFFCGDLFYRSVALGWRHALSGIGVTEILSLLAFTVTLVPQWRAKAFRPGYDRGDSAWSRLVDVAVPLRLLRLVSLESYFQSLHVLRNVVYLYRWPFGRAFLGLLAFWYIHATLLFLIERPSGLAEALGHKVAPSSFAGGRRLEGDVSIDMGMRYADLSRALQYSIVHIFGDYPLTTYTWWAKVVHFFGMLYGVAMMAACVGIFSSSFRDYLMEDRRKMLRCVARERLEKITMTVVRVQRAWRLRKARRQAIHRIPDPEVRERLFLGLRRRNKPGMQISWWRLAAREVYYGKSAAGKSVAYMFHMVLFFNLLITMALSMPELESERYRRLEGFCLVAEFACTCIFALELVIASSASPTASFARVFDFVCLLPGAALLCCNVVFGQRRLWGRLEALAMLRAFRTMDMKFFRKHVAFIRFAVADCLGLMGTPGFLALLVWIMSSSMFMFLENLYADEAPWAKNEQMSSLPSTMYWCCIFLTGEWAEVDFTYAGSRLSICYVLIGITLFCMPVGILIESVSARMDIMHEEEKHVSELLARTDAEQLAQPPPEVEIEMFDVALCEDTVFTKRMAPNLSKEELDAIHRASRGEPATISSLGPDARKKRTVTFDLAGPSQRPGEVERIVSYSDDL